MSPTPPTPSWPVPSSIGLGVWNEDEGDFEARSVVPITFESVGNDYTVSVELPNNTTDTVMALAFPAEMHVKKADSDENFEGFHFESSYVAWRSLTAMSDLTGNLITHLQDGAKITLYYEFS